MTFTPPTEYPAKYKQGDFTATLHGWFEGRYIGIWRHDQWGSEGAGMWNSGGTDFDGSGQLEDMPKRVVHWFNDYGSYLTGPCLAKPPNTLNGRVAVIRREMNEDGTDVQYFKEEKP